MSNLYYKFSNDFANRLEIILLANKYDKILYKNGNQTGGKIHIIEFEGYKFKIDISRDEDLIVIYLLQYDNDHPTCATILINKEEIGAIHGIGIYENCVYPPYKEHQGAGSLLLRFIIQFLRKNRDKLKIKRLELQDNSAKICFNCPERVKLSNMSMLLYGDTWYGKYGFRPIEKDHEGDTKSYQDRYKKNQEIMNTVLTRNVPLLDIIMKAGEKIKIDVNRDRLVEYLEKNRDKLLKDVLKEFLKNYDKFCCLFENMTDELIRFLGLYSFYKYQFYLDI
jgi:hypothetical protein